MAENSKKGLIITAISVLGASTVGLGTTTVIQATKPAEEVAEIVMTIGDDGFLYIDGEKSEYKIQLHEPETSIGDDGFVYVDGVKTNIVAKTSNPVATVGSDGFIYIDGEKTDIKAEANQDEIIYGNGVPTSTLGKDGDVYLNQLTNDIYNKVNGSWILIGELGDKISDDLKYLNKINNYLYRDNHEHFTCHQVLEVLEARNITATNLQDKSILWDSYNDCFVIEKTDSIFYAPDSAEESDKLTKNDYRLWKIYSEQVNTDAQTYSIYWNSTADFTSDLAVGFDAGKNTTISTLKYVGNDTKKTVTIRTNGGNLIIDNLNDEIFHYGEANELIVHHTAQESLHIKSKVNQALLSNGHVVLENNAEVGKLILKTSEKDAKKVFDNISLTINTNEVPVVLRDSIGVSELDCLVCKINTKESSEFIWLKGTGVKEEIVVTNDKEGTNIIQSSVQTTKIANQLANASISEVVTDIGVDLELGLSYSAQIDSIVYGSLAEAIKQANSGDTIKLVDYEKENKLTVFNEELITIDKNITIVGVNGPTFRLPSTARLFDVKDGFSLTLDSINFEGGARYHTFKGNVSNTTVDKIYDVEDESIVYEDKYYLQTALDNQSYNYSNVEHLFRNSGAIINATGKTEININNCSFKGFVFTTPKLFNINITENDGFYSVNGTKTEVAIGVSSPVVYTKLVKLTETSTPSYYVFINDVNTNVKATVQNTTSSRIIKSNGKDIDNKGIVNINNSIFSDNMGNSGAIYLTDLFGDCNINNSQIYNNHAIKNCNHGLFQVYANNWTIQDTTTFTCNNTKFFNNTWNGNGGIIGIYGGAGVFLNDCEFTGNYGGLYAFNGFQAINSISNGRCGMIYIHSASHLVCNGTTFTNNEVIERDDYTGKDWGANYPKGEYEVIYGIIDIRENSVNYAGTEGHYDYSAEFINCVAHDNYCSRSNGTKCEVFACAYIREIDPNVRWYKITDSNISGYCGDMAIITGAGEVIEFK